MKYKVKIEPIKNGFHATATEYKLTARGDTPEEAKANLRAGLRAYFRALRRAALRDA